MSMSTEEKLHQAQMKLKAVHTKNNAALVDFQSSVAYRVQERSQSISESFPDRMLLLYIPDL